jgi:hypothetical protein
MMRPARLLPLLAIPALLGGCAGLGRDQCLRAAVEEVRTLDRLIAETEAGLARGYGIDRQTVPYLERYRCADGSGTCLYTETYVEETPKAIDPASEDRKTALLRARRAAAVPRALAHIAVCRERFPQAQ